MPPQGANQQDQKGLIVILISETASVEKPKLSLIKGSDDTILESPVIDRRAWKKSQKEHVDCHIERQINEVLISLDDVISGFVGIINDKVEEKIETVCLMVWLDLMDNVPGLFGLDFAVIHVIKNSLASRLDTHLDDLQATIQEYFHLFLAIGSGAQSDSKI